MKFFKKSFTIILFLFVLLGVFKQAHIVNAAPVSIPGPSSNGCTTSALIELNKSSYSPGEKIDAGGVTVLNCNPGMGSASGSIGAALEYSPLKWLPVTGYTGSGAAFFTAPQCSGTVWYKANFQITPSVNITTVPIGIPFTVVGGNCVTPPPPSTATPPVLKDLSATYIDSTSVGQFEANLVSAGYTSSGVSATITEKGFCYFKTSESTTAAKCTQVSGLTTGVFQKAGPGAFGLTPDTEYWYYGYAKNSATIEGDVWGKFKTLPVGGGPGPNPQLYLTPTNAKSLVRAKDGSIAGTTYLTIDIKDLPTGKTCNLRDSSSVNPKANLATTIGPDFGIYGNKPAFSVPISGLPTQSTFQLVCDDSKATKSGPVPVLGQSGTLTAPTTCGITAGSSSCTNVPISWSTVNPYTTDIAKMSLFTQVKNPAGTSISSPANTGATTITVPYNAGGVTYDMSNSIDDENNKGATANQLDTKTITPYCISGTWDGKICVANAPDLIAFPADPDTAIINVNQTFTTTIMNQGTAKTPDGVKMNMLFQVAEKSKGGSPNLPTLSPATIGSIGAGGKVPFTAEYKFTEGKVYSVRFCVDEDTLWNGKVAEKANPNIVPSYDAENNNCSDWKDVTVGMPDLTAGPISPTSVTEDESVTLSSTITNEGKVATGGDFPNIFQFCSQAAVNGSCPDDANSLKPQAADPATMSELYAFGKGTNTGTAEIIHTFNTVGTYAVRACTDYNTSWKGSQVPEGNSNVPDTGEKNNCGPWTDVTVNAKGSSGNWTYPNSCQTCGVTTAYTIDAECTGGATCSGSAPAPLNCSVNAACPAPSFSVVLNVTPTGPILKGRSATLTWTSSGTSCYSFDFPTKSSGSPNILSKVGSQKVSPTSTTTYSLTCSKGGLSASDTKTVKVIVPVTVEN